MKSVQVNNELVELDFKKPVTHFNFQVNDQFYLEVTRYLLPDTQDHLPSDNGAIQYQIGGSSARAKKSTFLDFTFTLFGNKHCHSACDACFKGEYPTKDIVTVRFFPTYLSRFVTGNIMNKKDKVLAFKYPSSFDQQFTIENKTTRSKITELTEEKDYTSSLQLIALQSKLNELLLIGMDQIPEDCVAVPVCPFLTEVDMINKIYEARDILLRSLDSPITIKALSRKVTINECYLKKGFKEIFGRTIFDFYQEQRMNHAKHLLYEQGLSVTDTAILLGYSSISHFSTAFKKFTGIKPCELLLRP